MRPESRGEPSPLQVGCTWRTGKAGFQLGHRQLLIEPGKVAVAIYAFTPDDSTIWKAE